MKRVRYLFKYILVMMLVFFLFLQQSQKKTKDIDMEELQQKIVPDMEDGEIVSAGELELRRLYGISLQDTDGFLLYIPGEIMSVQELCIIKAKTDEEVTPLREKVKERLESQKRSFESYGTTQMAQLNEARVITKGRYLFFAVSDEADEWQEKFEQEITP